MESSIIVNSNNLPINLNSNIIYDKDYLSNVALTILSNSPYYSWSNITITDNDVIVSGNSKK